ncbi:MAG: ABC transporter ATP-binding protein, partial [Candidatus Cloacimonetes bacterium]|nr:ABC transporter ATP-binding protein [Candidatus Cloacimonadota bacterium]
MMHGQGGGGNWAQDDIQGKIYDRRLYARLLRYLKPYKWMVIVSFLILMLITTTELILPLITRTAIDKYITSDQTIAIFEDNGYYETFVKRYEFLKRDEGRINGRAYLIFSTKDRTRIDKTELNDLEQRHILSRINIYTIANKEDNRQILNRR